MSISSSPLASELPACTELLADEKEITILLPGREPVRARSYGVRARQPVGSATPLVLHFHGGNFVCGDLEQGRNVARMLVDAGAAVVSMAYPLAPLHPFPDAIEVGYEALAWLYKHRAKFAGKGARVYLAGEEAGGNLAAALALIARDRAHPPLAGQILVSPMLDPCVGTASLRKAMGDASACKYSEGWQQYLRCPRDAEHPYAVPGSASRLVDIAPTLVLTGQDDPMRDEAVKYAKRLADAGIDARCCVVDQARNWPDALAEPPTQCACSRAVTAEFRSFFAGGEAQPAPSATAPQPPH
ncbi:alpha/beta hydrolase [Variovorax ginsengisoli]|uniref:Acetyl esterase/lipase n=1 Tax=Variovorax ginsengisoli TaxID=363844 RepID=A0ABT9SFB5_9BURK|nr:alpha/beta hydrolase [Variovorax ginsengisoli]MDP9902915.1 acetyl esterase/lipase [Variovorax ginsengisoli]